MRDIRWGEPARELRSSLLDASGPERDHVLERFLSRFIGGFTIKEARARNLETHEENLIVTYRFASAGYGKVSGDLLLVRPRVLGEKADDLLEGKRDRRQPVEFPYASRHTDDFEIRLPTGWTVDEIPPAADIDAGFATYHAKSEVDGGVLRYTRSFEVHELLVPVSRMNDLKSFYRQVAADQRASVVLKRKAP